MEDNTLFRNSHRKTMQQSEDARVKEAANQPVQGTFLSRSVWQLVKKYRREFEPGFMQDEFQEVK